MHHLRRGNGHARRACSLYSLSSLRPRTINPSTMRSRPTRTGHRQRCRCLRCSRARRRWLRNRLSLGVPNLFLRPLRCMNPARPRQSRRSSIQIQRLHSQHKRGRHPHSTSAPALHPRSPKLLRLPRHLELRLALSPLRQRRRSSTGLKCLKPTPSRSRNRIPNTPFLPHPQAVQPRSRSATPGRPRASCRGSKRTRTSRRPWRSAARPPRRPRRRPIRLRGTVATTLRRPSRPSVSQHPSPSPNRAQ